MSKEVETKKSDKGKQKYKNIEKEQKKILRQFKTELYFTMATYLSIMDAKEMVVKKLETIEGIGTFLKTDDGYKVTAPEGFVAIDSSGGAVKLVDRLGFSHANFTIAKDW
jgi:phenylalanine-4-hydroxylase